jgi:cyclohexadieny/prephenate dehydrogenase
MTQIFDHIAILGFGLIGSSIARAVKENGLARRITCGDVSDTVCVRVRELGLADDAMTDLAAAVAGADLVILATPVLSYVTVGQKIAAGLKPGAIVSDVGSVKQAVIKDLSGVLPRHAHFVPAHPISGSEQSGPDAGFATLFQKRWCILTPEPTTNADAVAKVQKLWEGMGASVATMPASQHDLTLAITSHLPHLIAYTIVDTATNLGQDLQADVIKYSAGGFRDFTRIAASDPTMWRDIFLANKDAVLEMLQRFSEDLTALQRAIRGNDGDMLYGVFTRTRAIRKQIIDQGQADYRSASGLSPDTPLATAPHTASRSQT